ncbi:hypothetical protein RR48_03940 [Papilio machaon]|uniref:Uncharacterized protein n=1 Tax=Papilio machaon TaxID=76193 RepID=A0A0N0PCE6_PAPMA|nr:hypothetical protein RR48_03940 [Papilio machaon]
MTNVRRASYKKSLRTQLVENDSYSSDESIGTFLANHKLSPSAPSRNSVHLDSQKSQTSEGRQSRSSAGSLGSKPQSPVKESYA